MIFRSYAEGANGSVHISDMKRILITTGVFAPDIGGPASYARTLGSRLAAQGITVDVLAYSSILRHAGDANMPFAVHRVWKKIPWGIRHVLFFFRCIQYARHADVVLVLNTTTAGVTSTVAARLVRKPVAVRVVGDAAWESAVLRKKTFLLIDDFQRSPVTGRTALLRWMQSWTCRNAAAIIVPSTYLAQLVAGWGVPDQKISIIYNGVEMPVLTLSKEDARRRLGISGNIILSAGRLVPWKGFRMLIKLMPQLLQVNQFFRLIIVGDGDEMSVLSTMVRNLGLERKVFVVGKKSSAELALYLAAADLFVLNTSYEGFSHQVLEAMAAGVPVITTTAGGNREAVTQGENGFLVRYNDEFNLVEAIKTLWREQELREQFIANGKQTAAGFTARRMEEQTVALLNTLTR